MIIYDATVNQFRTDVIDNSLADKIFYNLKTDFGIRVSPSEKRSWWNSLPSVLELLPEEENDNRYVLCEFNIPTSKKRIDFVILGKDKNNFPSGYILELKQWSNIKEVDYNDFSVGRYNDSHPCFQANNYMMSLNYAMGLIDNISLKTSAYLHNMKLLKNYSPLLSENYKNILNEAKLYTDVNKDDLRNVINQQTIIRNGKDSRELFKDATWKPTKELSNILKEDFSKIKLWGSQEIIYSKIKRFIKTFDYKNDKKTFLISGDPGSGKTIIAFKIFNLINQELIKHKIGPVQMMIPGQEVRKAFIHKFRSHYLEQFISGSNMRKGYTSVIIDEGHKAIGRDVGEINYKRNYKQINFAIIFIDDDQVINKKGITKSEVKKIAIENGHKVYEYNIEENFRALGERALLDWIDFVFYKRKTQNGGLQYEQFQYNNNSQNYKLYSYDSPNSFSDTYMQYTKDKTSKTRMVSLWSKGYYIGKADEDGFPKAAYKIGNHEFVWNPNEEWANKLRSNNEEYWNGYNKEVKKFSADRKLFLTANPDPRFIAYFNHIQGYEFDNIFVYIPSVFTYNNSIEKIIFHKDRLAKEVRSSQAWAYGSNSKKMKGKTNEEIYQINKGFFINRIKVMLTRGIRSTHIFAEDKSLNEYISNTIIKQTNSIKL